MRKILLAIAITGVACGSASAAIFQYALPLETKKGERMAYLWVPSQADEIRGVVMGGMTLMERELAQDDRIRQACADQQLAILFLHTGLKSVDTPEVLRRFAEHTGYRELEQAPILFVGHSAGGPQARWCAREHAERCIALVQYRGADPGDVDHDGEQGIPPGVPALMMIGQFDEFGKIGRDVNGVENWEKDRDKLQKFRQQHEHNLGSILVEPGGGHFAWSDRNAEFLAMYIRKAAQARIDKPGAPLREVDPASGWLTDLTIKPPVKFPPAPFDEYEGDKQQAAWHFDEELARATIAYHEGIARQDQFIKWNDPHRVVARARNFFTKVDWVGDGQTFEIHPAYAEKYPTVGARWGKSGEAVGHADAPILIKYVSGPIARVGQCRFRIEYNELAPATANGRVTFMAYSEGDATYRYTERVGMLNADDITFSAGKPQTMTFKKPPNLSADADPLTLDAASDAGLPVRFHIGYGPASIENGKLHIAEIPKRATFPLTVQVVAYQPGSGLEPKVQTAAPIVHTLQVLAP